jgi:3',5'-nucleoside bisphosphate phosphatase
VSAGVPTFSARRTYVAVPLADLHTHTNRSDGRLSPPGLVEKAARRGLAALAVTDHDSVEGLPLAAHAAREHGITLVPGVELSAWADGRELHLLGYAFDPADPALRAHLAHYRADRERRAREIVARLGELGAPVRWERVAAIAGRGAIGRPHLAHALVEARHVGSVGEAFLRYLGDGAPANVGKTPVAPAELIALVHGAGGVCVLAHPYDLPEAAVAALVADGLDGIEVVHPAHDADRQAHWAEVAARHGLLATGGSDHHGFRGEEEDERFGRYGVSLDALAALLRQAEVHRAAAGPA